MHIYPDALAVVRDLRPDEPVILNRPHAARRAARFFVEKFPGKSLYAVKANPSPALIALLWDNGITHFDVASLSEVRLVRDNAPEAVLCFMHPVKAEEAIREAYFDHGVRTFSLDTSEELDKIVRATDGATDLTLCVRIRVSSDHSKLSLASKFGADPADVKQLLIDTRPGRRFGLAGGLGINNVADAICRVAPALVPTIDGAEPVNWVALAKASLAGMVAMSSTAKPVAPFLPSMAIW